MSDYLPSEFDPSMSKWTLGFVEGDTNISYTFFNIYGPEIVQHFRQFMQSTGFSDEVIIDSFEKVVAEVRDHEAWQEARRSKSSQSS